MQERIKQNPSKNRQLFSQIMGSMWRVGKSIHHCFSHKHGINTAIKCTKSWDCFILL